MACCETAATPALRAPIMVLVAHALEAGEIEFKKVGNAFHYKIP